ncbi:MAG: NAD-dependent epimerase/dehydratase family protein [Intrasporangium sp.]|uniref:NAD-dependent epimerase/dehydratase family protein n=1 Tax=Intrasporangium sp. TaxID=1925024 RepID=UPI002648208D|nr:NAD-dependent epimerase/dehydratase family protein [Intrasporangium sp.]MDN5796090.1 NAD-dependent epimerase/dehydratase family protein [Intrasporangium sp.]
MRYALTGATGFVGGELARQLVSDGHEVVALVRSPGKAADLEALAVDLVPGDLDDGTALDRLLDGADGLFHVAGWYKLGQRDPTPGQRVNVEGTRHVLEAARRAGTPKVVYTSTLAVNSDTNGRILDETYHYSGPHLSEYDRTKAEAHAVAREFAAAGLPVVIVMPGGIYGPGDTSQVGELIAQVVAGRRVQAPNGGGELVWAHVSDVARGHILAMERGVPGESYMLAGDRGTLADLLERTARIAGTKGPVLVPTALLRAGEKVMAQVSKVVPVPPLYHPETLRSALASYLGTRQKAEHDLGWHARPLDEGLADTVAAIRAG